MKKQMLVSVTLLAHLVFILGADSSEYLHQIILLIVIIFNPHERQNDLRYTFT